MVATRPKSKSLLQREGDARFRLIVENAKDYAIFFLTPAGTIETWNLGAERINGYATVDIVGRHISTLYPPTEGLQEHCARALEVAVAHGCFEDEGWRLRRDGSVYWASHVVTSLADDDGQLVGFGVIMRDLTERREAEEDARRFQLLVESVKDYGIFILNAQGFVETWNIGAQRLNGYNASEIVGKHFSVFYPQASVKAGQCEHELETAADAGRLEDEGWRARKDGTTFWANVTLTALRDTAGRLVGFANVTRDLTERRASEQMGRRFRLLIDSVRDYGIFILNPHGFIETWNQGAQRLKGYTAAEIIGKHFSIFYPREDVIAGKCERELELAARDGRFEDEGWRLRRDGTAFWANVTITALRNDDGVLVGFAKVTRDLTERRTTEMKLRELAAEKAALAEKARIQEFQERFVAILGHDLRNPLSAIEVSAQLLRRQGDGTNRERVLERISNSTRRMSRMIEQILDLTRSRLAGGFELRLADTELDTALQAIVDEIVPSNAGRQVLVDCPKVVGYWDGDRLEQVFSNLLGNAMQYGDPAKPVSIVATHKGATVAVAVHNHGPAIPTALQERLFDPFRRGARDSRTHATAGLGLGLSISREIVRAHGGDITVSSNATEGTTFCVTLPMRTVVTQRPAESSA